MEQETPNETSNIPQHKQPENGGAGIAEPGTAEPGTDATNATNSKATAPQPASANLAPPQPLQSNTPQQAQTVSVAPWPAAAAPLTAGMQAQALQVGAGSQGGFVLPTVNQLPMPAAIGIPNVFNAALVPPPAVPLPPKAAPGKRKADESQNGTSNKQAKITEPSVVSSYSTDFKVPAASAVMNGIGSSMVGTGEESFAAAVTDEQDFSSSVDPNVDVEKLPPAEKRRHERNMREQQRSYRISQQIKQLRDVLEENKIPFKPNKFSILVSIVEYIKQLQARAIMLDSEHARLMETMRQTTEMVSNGQVPVQSSSGEESPVEETSSSAILSNDLQSAEGIIKGLNFETVFQKCPCALGIASLDGRVLACNEHFEELMCVHKAELLHQSMFMYIRNHQDIFEAMADLLKRSSAAAEAGDGIVASGDGGGHLLFWCGYIISLEGRKLAFSITLTNTSDGDPKYFSLSISEFGNY